MEKAKVLIMEDELVLAHDLEDILRKRGYDVVGTASSGEDAIKLAQATNPDLILADIKLQGTMDGIDSAERISEDCDCAIVYLTAFTEPDLFEKAKGTEPYGYLTKPVAPQELVRTVEMALYKHQMEKRLRESEAKYRRIVETTIEGVWAMDRKLRTTFVNQRMAEMLGYCVDEMLGRRFDSFMFQEDLGDHETKMEERRRGGHQIYERRFRRKDGEAVWTTVSATALKDAQGNFNGSFALFTDITERKKSKESLRESEEKFRLVIENAREAIYVIQGDRIGFANPFALELSGHSEEELYSTHYTEFIFTDDREMVRQNYLRRLRGEYAPTRYSFRIVSKRGEPIWVEVDPVTITWKGQIALLVFALDITERKKAEAALKQSEEKFRLIAETIEEVFWVSKPGITEMIYVSPSYEKIWGRTRSSLYERPISFMEAVHPEDREKLSGSIDEHARGSWRYEYRIVQPDGTVRWIEDHGFPIRDDKGTLRLMTGVARDITERKCAEDERERLVLELERSLAELKRLRGILPICSSCKKIRDDQGYWQQIEAYVSEHSEAEFSHGICPECAEKLYPGFFPKEEK